MKLIFLLLFCLYTFTTAQEIEYTIKIENPNRNYFNIEIVYAVENQEYVDFVMPVWTPGSYVIKDWSKNVIEVKARNQSNSVLKTYKIDKQTWRVETHNSDKVNFSYKVYAYSLNNPYHAHIEKDFAYFNGAVIFMYVKGKKNLPCNLEFEYPEDWEIHTSLQIKLNENKYQAINFDEFIDCPAFMGRLHKFSFEVQNKKHFVVFNKWYDINEDQIVEDLTIMINWFYEMFGELPYKHYTFFLRVSEKGGGGIEHLYSNVSAIRPSSLKGDINDSAYYSKLLMLESHEYFHLYNVKRIRPSGLGPFDYTKEVYTKLLWVSEGFTSYYTHRPLSKSGILKEDKIFESWATYVNSLADNSALNFKPISHYSFDAWLRSEIPDYSFRVYYTKGALIALLLDIEMRLQTNHEKNMDAFFNYLYYQVYKKDLTFNLKSFYEHLSDYSKIDFSTFFEKYIAGVDELPLTQNLNRVGLELSVEEEIPFIGIKLNKKVSDAALISFVYSNSPADQINMGRGDHIISINGEKVTLKNWKEVLSKIELKNEIVIAWFHDNKIINSEIEIKNKIATDYSIKRKSDISEDQKQFLEKWLLP